MSDSYSPQLIEAIQNVCLLLEYTAHNGMVVDPNILRTLTNARRCLAANEWTEDHEADFWQAFSELNTMVKPVTIESLKVVSNVTVDITGKRLWRFLGKAYRAVVFYIVLALSMLFLLLAVQIYTLVGSKLYRQISVLNLDIQRLSELDGFKEGIYQKENDALRMQLETSSVTLIFWSNVWSWLPDAMGQRNAEKTFSKEDYKSEINRLREALHVATVKLQNAKDFGLTDEGLELIDVYQNQVNLLTKGLLDKKAEYERGKNEYTRTEIELQTWYVLNILQSYLLPILYGLLGALAYVLRSLIQDIRTSTYTRKSDIRYGSRIFLGALAGTMIGYFITPAGAEDSMILSPMAISFLAGYNVELLFLAMDRVIAWLSKRKRPAQTAENQRRSTPQPVP